MSKIIITENQYIRIFLNESDTPPEEEGILLKNNRSKLKNIVINSIKTKTLPEIENLFGERKSNSKNAATKFMMDKIISMYQEKITSYKDKIIEIIDKYLDDIISNLQSKDCKLDNFKKTMSSMISEVSNEVKNEINNMSFPLKKVIKSNLESRLENNPKFISSYYQNNLYYPIWLILLTISQNVEYFARKDLKINSEKFCNSNSDCCLDDTAFDYHGEPLWSPQVENEVKNIFNYIKNMDTNFF